MDTIETITARMRTLMLGGMRTGKARDAVYPAAKAAGLLATDPWALNAIGFAIEAEMHGSAVAAHDAAERRMTAEALAMVPTDTGADPLAHTEGREGE